MKEKIIRVIIVATGFLASIPAVSFTGRVFDAYGLPLFNEMSLIHGTFLVLYPLYWAAFYYIFKGVICLVSSMVLKRNLIDNNQAGFSKCAVISLLLSCFGFMVPFLGAGGIVAGHLARKTCRKNPLLGGAGLAGASIFLGYTTFLMYACAIAAVYYISS